MPVFGWREALAEEVSEMTEHDENDVAEVSRKEDVVGRVLLFEGIKVVGTVLGRVAVGLVGAVPEFDVAGGEDLLGGRRRERAGEYGVWVEVVKVIKVAQRFGHARRFGCAVGGS